MGDTQRPLSAAALAAAAGTVSVSVPHLPAAQAVRAAVAHYNERRSPGSRPAALTSNPQFLARITVNYLLSTPRSVHLRPHTERTDPAW